MYNSKRKTMHSIKQLKELLDKEGVKWEEEFKKNYKMITISGEVGDTKMRHIIDFCHNNSLFYALDNQSKFYIY